MSIAEHDRLPRGSRALSGRRMSSAIPRELAAYEIDGKKPAAVVRPGSSEEVAEIVKFAAARKAGDCCHRRAHEARDGIASAAIRSRARYDAARSRHRLRSRRFDARRRSRNSASRSSRALLAEHGQFLPLAVPFMDRATVGGTIASGVDSPLRQLYGTARDYVLGMEFVTGEGLSRKAAGAW